MTGNKAELSRHLLELLTLALDKVGETIFLMGDGSPKFIHVNETAAKKLGYSREELTGGMSVFDIDPHWSPSSWDSFWPELRDRGTVVIETEHRTKGGQMFPVEITANYFEFGGQAYNVAICRDIADRKRAEEELRQSEHQFRNLVENWPDEIARYDLDCRRVYVNPMMQSSLGASAPLLGLSPTETYPDSPEIALYEQKIREVIESGVPATFDMGWGAPAPSSKYRILRLMPERDARGHVTGVLAIARDISERKKAEDQLRISEERLNEAQHVAKIGSWVWHPDGSLDWSEALFEVFNIPPDVQPTIDLFNEIVHPDDRELVMIGFQEWIESDRVSNEAEYRIRWKDGSVHNLLAIGKKECDKSGAVIRAFGTCQDITERTAAEEKLKQADAKIAEILESITDGFVALDHDWRFSYVNTRAAQRAGLTREQMIGTRVEEVFPGHPSPKTQELLAKGESITVETYVEQLRSWFESHIFPTKDGVSIYSRDITERKQAEIQLSTLTEHSPDAIARFDREGRYVYANSTIERIAGINPQDLIGHQYGEVLGEQLAGEMPPDVLKMRKAITEVFATGLPKEIELSLPLRNGDHDFNVRLIPEFDNHDEAVSVLSVARDITERKQATMALRNVLRHARTVVMHSLVTAPEGWDQHDPEWSAGRYLWESVFEDEETAQKVLPLEVPTGRQYSHAWHANKVPEDEEVMHLIAARAFVSGAPSWRQEFRVNDRFGKMHWFTQAANVESTGHGRWRVTTVNTDITDRMLAEEQVRENMVRMQLQESALIALTKKEVLEEGDVAASLRRLTEASAKALGVERVSLWRYKPGGGVMECLDLFELSKDVHSSGMTLTAVDYPIYFKALATCDVIAADNAQRNPQTQEFAENYLKPLGISSMLDVPILLKGNLDGVLCHEHVGAKREWTSDERTFAVAMANFVTLVLEERERKQAQDELTLSQQAYASLVNTVDGIVWELDVETFRFTFVSEQAARILGYATDLWLSDTDFWADHLHPEDRAWAVNFCLTATHEMRDHDFQYRMIAADGHVVWLHDLVTVVVEKKQPVKLRGIMVDITDRKFAEEEREGLETKLRQAQKIEALGTLAGGIAHDFNNILGTILGNVDLAIKDGQDNPALQASLDQIRKAGHRARDLTQQILLFGRQQISERRVISLAPIVDQCVSLLKATLPARVTVQGSIARSAQPVLADASQLLQVLVNLGTNAAHAMQDIGGTIDIRVESVAVDKGFAKTHPDLEPGKYARISVSDTGHGMDAVTQLRIFEPFFTTKSVGEGTGLGLSVVHGIVSSHGGVILVHSEIGTGSTFELYLPAADATVEDVDRKPDSKVETKGHGQHILCIDDDEPLVFLLKRMLERQGYRVTGYTDSREALDAFRAGPDQFDAVVTDYNMPGMSGLEVARVIGQIRPNLSVAVASGYITDELKAEAMKVGITDLIFKPNAVDEYSEVVARLVEKSS